MIDEYNIAGNNTQSNAQLFCKFRIKYNLENLLVNNSECNPMFKLIR